MCSSYLLLGSELPSTRSLIQTFICSQLYNLNSHLLEHLGWNWETLFPKDRASWCRLLSDSSARAMILPGGEGEPPCMLAWTPPLHSEWLPGETKWELPGLFRSRPSIWSPSAIGPKYPRPNSDSKGRSISCQLPWAAITNCQQESRFSH